MGIHDLYGKKVMKKAFGVEYKDHGYPVQIVYGEGEPARIDGTIGTQIAVEIESRTSKQVRGAILDLICHRYPFKLLVILPVHMSNPEVAVVQYRNILSRFIDKNKFNVVLLKGSGYMSDIEHDVTCVRVVAQRLQNYEA